MTNSPLSTPAQPCKSCPWRCDQKAADIPGFDLALAEQLSDTCPDERNTGPAWGAALFACHQSKPGNELICRGWLAQVGRAHPSIRLAVLQGRLSPQLLTPNPAGPALHNTYPEVLAKLRSGT